MRRRHRMCRRFMKRAATPFPRPLLCWPGPTPLSTMTWALNMLTPTLETRDGWCGLSVRLRTTPKMAAPANQRACGTARVNPLQQRCKASHCSGDAYFVAIISRAPFSGSLTIAGFTLSCFTARVVAQVWTAHPVTAARLDHKCHVGCIAAEGRNMSLTD